jgi:hypothetical protein
MDWCHPFGYFAWLYVRLGVLMVQIRITWNPNKAEETIISYTSDFLWSDWLTKADMLKDAIGELTDMYESVLNEKDSHVNVNA